MELRPYQEKAIEFWLKYKKVYFAIDMGLGKTAIVLHAINQLGLRALVVAPLKVTYNTWPDEIEDWDMQGELRAEVLHGPDKLKRFKSDAQVHVINYEGLPWLYSQLYEMHKANKSMPYKVLVLDESTYIKDPNSNRFKYLVAMRDMFDYIANLSGTPSPNSLMDLWAQYYILDKGKSLGNQGKTIASKFNGFRNKFFEKSSYCRHVWEIRFGAETAIHKAIASQTFRLQSNDFISLPQRVFNNITLEMLPKEKALYKSFKKDFVLFLEGTSIESLNAASLSSKLRQFVQGSVYENLDSGAKQSHYIHDIKVRALKHLVNTNPGKNILCLVQFKFEIEMLLKVFPEVPYITGATSSSQGNEYIQQWKKGEIPLLLAHPRAVGRGLNLQSGGSTLVWYALPWSLDDYLQTNKRLHRTGQKETVIIHHLILKGTIDEDVLKAQRVKDATQAKLLEYLRQKTKEKMND